MSNSKKIHGVVRLDAVGEIVCFCSYDNYLRKRCVCRDHFDCPEAMIEITIIPGTRPSDQNLEPIQKLKRTVKKATRDINSIKKGVSRLERDMRRFPIK